jgi:hypothetical protein
MMASERHTRAQERAESFLAAMRIRYERRPDYWNLCELEKAEAQWCRAYS